MKGVKVITDRTAQILKGISLIDSKEVLVGIPEDKAARKEGTVTNAQIGYIQDRGSPVNNIPPSPFLEPGVAKISDEASGILRQGVIDTLSGKPDAMDEALNKAGLIAQASIREVITSQEGFEPLSEATLAARKAKGFEGEKRLIRTGQLRNSINYVIRDKKRRG